MDIQGFLKDVADSTLVHRSLIRRLMEKHGTSSSNGNYRAFITRLKEKELVVTHNYGDPLNFQCYSLSENGFKVLGISRNPHIKFPERKAKNICDMNYMRLSITKEIQNYPHTKIGEWRDGSQFAKAPLLVSKRIRENATQEGGIRFCEIRPYGGMHILSGKEDTLLLFDFWDNVSDFKHTALLYSLYIDKKVYTKDFDLPPETRVRVVWILPNKNTFFRYKPFFHYLRGGAHFYFLCDVYAPDPLQSKIWMNNKGGQRNILRPLKSSEES